MNLGFFMSKLTKKTRSADLVLIFYPFTKDYEVYSTFLMASTVRATFGMVTSI